ncbi:hypothetical protein [Nocardia sp. CA-290969]|uniref:hypothetical protein n=1 Tax=Nocardia sp. CA-290969 TaxID=3239986 RepID=UPI003D92BFBB
MAQRNEFRQDARRCAAKVAGVTAEFFVERAAVPTADHTTDTDPCERPWEQSGRLVRLPVGSAGES